MLLKGQGQYINNDRKMNQRGFMDCPSSKMINDKY